MRELVTTVAEEESRGLLFERVGHWGESMISFFERVDCVSGYST
jgi:hypothetical protein